MPENSTWTTTTGLLDDFTGTVTDAFFGTDAKVQNGEVLILKLTMATDSEDVPEVTQFFSCGKGWESVDGGKTARDEGGNKRRGFNKNSAYGTLIDRCVLGTEAGGLDIGKVLGDRGEATEAKVWLGLKFHWKTETEGYTDRTSGEKKTFSRLLPQTFIADGDSADNTAGSTGNAVDDKKAAAKAKAAAAKAAKANGNGGGDLRSQLLDLARAHDSHESFVDAAMDVDGVVDDDALLAEVVEESALYAEARA